jgi:hypothetical protein
MSGDTSPALTVALEFVINLPDEAVVMCHPAEVFSGGRMSSDVVPSMYSDPFAVSVR